MKAFAQRIMRLNYKKRIIAAVIAAGVLLAATAILIPTALHTQISELRAWKQEQERSEEITGESTDEEAAGEYCRSEKAAKKAHGEKEHGIKSALRILTPVPTGVKVAFAAIAVLAIMTGVFYWITFAEWLYKTAVLKGLNRALWPMLGLVFNILILPVLLIVLCDPKRAESGAKQ